MPRDIRTEEVEHATATAANEDATLDGFSDHKTLGKHANDKKSSTHATYEIDPKKFRDG